MKLSKIKLSKEELKIINEALKAKLTAFQWIDKAIPYTEQIKFVQDLHDKIADEIVRILEKTKLKNLR